MSTVTIVKFSRQLMRLQAVTVTLNWPGVKNLCVSLRFVEFRNVPSPKFQVNVTFGTEKPLLFAGLKYLALIQIYHAFKSGIFVV